MFATLQSCLAELDGFNKASFFCEIAADRLLRKRIRVPAPLGGQFRKLVLLLRCEMDFHMRSLSAKFSPVNEPYNTILPCYNPSPHAHRPNSAPTTSNYRATPHPAGGRARLDARRIRRDAVRAGANPRHARSGHVESDFGAALHADSAGVGDGRGALRLSGRPRRTQTRLDAKHPHLFHLLVCFGTLDDRFDAGRVSLHPRTGDGRRMEYRCDSGRGNLAP